MRSTIALATGIWLGAASVAAAGQEPARTHNPPTFEAAAGWVVAAAPRKKAQPAKKVQPAKEATAKTNYLTRSDLAYSMKRWISQIEGTSKEAWNGKNGGYYTFYDVPIGHPDRVMFLTLVNGYHLWDGVPMVTKAKFNPDEAVTRTEVLQVIRNLWASQEMARFTKGQAVAVTFPAGLRPTDKITQSQFTALAAPTLSLFKSAVATSLSDATSQLNKDALAASENREAVLIRESTDRDAKDARLARDQAAIQAAQLSAQQSRNASSAQAQASWDAQAAIVTRDALAAKTAVEARDAQMEKAILAEKAVEDAEAAAEVKARLVAIETKQLREDRLLRDQNDRYLGARPISLSLSSMAWTSMATPITPYLGPVARAEFALYPGPAFVTGQAKLGMFPGGPGTLMAAAAPQLPVFRIPDIAALQLQPYIGGRANLGWAGSTIEAGVGPMGGVVGRVHAGPVSLFASTEATFPWSGKLNQLASVPILNVASGVEFELNKSLSLIAGWDAQYGQEALLPYTGGLSTGVNLGF